MFCKSNNINVFTLTLVIKLANVQQTINFNSETWHKLTINVTLTRVRGKFELVTKIAHKLQATF